MSSTLVDIGVHNIHKQGAYSIIWHEIFPLILDDLKDADRIIPPPKLNKHHWEALHYQG